VWDIETGKALDALQGHTAGVQSVTISPNGKYIVSSSDDTIQVWDVTHRVLGASLPGHTANVLSVAILPDGQSIVSGSDDRTIQVQ
jgi:WD40 repeat protein